MFTLKYESEAWIVNQQEKAQINKYTKAWKPGIISFQ